MATQQEPEYADEHKVWRKTSKDGKPSALQGSNVITIKENRQHYPEYYEAIFGKDSTEIDPNTGLPKHEDGLYDKCLKLVNGMPGGEEKPTTIIGDWKVGVTYNTQYGYSVYRVPVKQGGFGGGGGRTPLLTLTAIYVTDVVQANKTLAQQQPGDVYRFESIDDEGHVTILKLRKVD